MPFLYLTNSRLYIQKKKSLKTLRSKFVLHQMTFKNCLKHKKVIKKIDLRILN